MTGGHPLVLLLAFFLCLGLSSCATITFDETYAANCAVEQGGCQFTNESIWVNGTIPQNSDSVFVNVSSLNLTSPVLIFLTGQNISLELLELDGFVAFLVLDNSTATVSNLGIHGNTFLVIRNNSEVYSNNTWVHGTSKIHVEDSGAFTQLANLFVLHSNATLNISTGGRVILDSYAEIFGALSFAPSSVFASYGGITFGPNFYELDNNPIIYLAGFNSSQVVFRNGLTHFLMARLYGNANVSVYHSLPELSLYSEPGTIFKLAFVNSCTIAYDQIGGTLYLSTASVLFVPHQNVSFPMIIGGEVDLSGDTIYIQTISFTTGQLNEPPNLSVIGNNVYVYGPLVIPGEIYAHNIVHLYGSISISDSVNTAGSIIINGTLTTGNPIDLALMDPNHPPNFLLLHSNSVLKAPAVFIGAKNTLEARDSTIISFVELFRNSTLEGHNTAIIGNLVSDGLVRVREDRTLYISGNYTQSAYGALEVRDVDLVNETAGFVNVSGIASLNGTLVYTIRDNATHGSKKIQLLVILADGTVTGKFDEKSNSGLVYTDLGLEYSDHSVHLVFQGTGKDKRGSKKSLWWVWMIVAMATVSVFGLIGLLYSTRHRRRGYGTVMEETNASL